ncbi:MAG: tetratricopeptide repeat protein [Lachnospiraceae bacterium]|nr:tetratricopeptide repeat protein [Lachnospiraceae bacterium]
MKTLGWLLLVVAIAIPVALIYNKLAGKITGKTPEETARKQMENLANRRDFNGAIQAGYRLVGINPSAQNHYLLGRCYELNKEFGRAIDSYLKAVEVDPTFYMAYNNLGTAYLNQKENEKAKEVLEKAYEIRPDHPYVTSNLAYTCALFGENERARTLLEEAKKAGFMDHGDVIGRKIRESEAAQEAENEKA